MIDGSDVRLDDLFDHLFGGHAFHFLFRGQHHTVLQYRFSNRFDIVGCYKITSMDRSVAIGRIPSSLPARIAAVMPSIVRATCHAASIPSADAGLYCVAEERALDHTRLRGSVIQAPYYCEDCGYAVHMPFALRVRMAADEGMIRSAGAVGLALVRAGLPPLDVLLRHPGRRGVLAW